MSKFLGISPAYAYIPLEKFELKNNSLGKVYFLTGIASHREIHF